MASIISAKKFTQFLVDQQPVYDKLIIKDIRPEASWIGHVETGQFEAHSGTEHTFDRFRHVYPNVTKPWNRVNASSCIGTPCDKNENKIGWGYTRETFFLEEQSWATDLLCFDQIMHVTQAKEHFSQIVNDILRPATEAINSNFLRKRAADHAGKKWLASATMADFTFTWDATGVDGDEIYIDTSGTPTSKLTPQMLQRRVHPLMLKGYLGKNPFVDMPPLIELVTDMETAWDLDHAVADAGINGNWRFQDWSSANKYYKYAFQGQLGNYAIRVDPMIHRFNKVATNRFQLILPYKNVAATEGIGSEENPDFALAQYQFSLIWHRRAMKVLTMDNTTIHSQMPFAKRDFGGKWQFVMDNLGADVAGEVIENKRRNKGQFIADFKLAVKPQFVEFAELIFHKREPAYVVALNTSATDPGYPDQVYTSENESCDTDTLAFTPEIDGDDNYVIAANTIQCNGVPIVHVAISEASLADLVTALNAAGTNLLGTWEEVVGSDTEIQVTGTTCFEITIPFVT